MEQAHLYLSARDAAAMLGVNMQTLYAYVSRKMLRSEKIDGSRARRYWRADVERLAGKPDPQAPALPVDTELASATRITLITGQRLFFRGRDVAELAQSETVESMAALLWQQRLDGWFAQPAAALPGVAAGILQGLDGVGILEKAGAIFPLLERADPRAYDLTPAGYARTGVDVLRWFAALVVGAHAPADGPLHLFVARALQAPAGYDEVIRTLFVLVADHEFDPITYAVRAVANVGVTPFQAVTAGLIASQGQRFQAERYGVAARFLQEILAADDGAAPVVERLRHGEALPGFSGAAGGADIRTTILMAALGRVAGADPLYQRLCAAQRMALDSAHATMDFIFPAMFVGYRLGLKGDALAIALIGRLVGWIAHAMEQYHEHALIRPRARYAGLLPA